MRTDALFNRYGHMIAAAGLAAHARAQGGGFRQRDVRFLVELFSNWLQSTLDGYVIPLSNTQISRYLDGLVGESYLKRLNRKGYPQYRLTRAGLIELLNLIVRPEVVLEKEHFLFCYTFIASYRERIWRLIEAEGKKLPLSTQ